LWALLISITCHWPSWGTLKVLACSPNPPVDAYLRSPARRGVGLGMGGCIGGERAGARVSRAGPGLWMVAQSSVSRRVVASRL